MTDYLEWLLDLQEPEDEEDGETLAWCGAALDRLAVRRTEDGADEGRGTELSRVSEGPTSSAVSGGRAEKATAEDGAEGSAPSIVENLRRAADWRGQAADLLRTAGGAARPEDGATAGIIPAAGDRSAAERLYRELAQSGRVERMGRQTDAPSTGIELSRPVGQASVAPDGANRAGGWTPEALDRVFQRDARRYDVGFTLY